MMAYAPAEHTDDLCICILAHNEQKHIAATIKALAADSAQLGCGIKVYANGCTDATVAIVRELMLTIPRLSLRELTIASKPNTWNTAFHENANPILVFSDGDVIPETGAIEVLWRLLTKERLEIILAGCSFWPRKAGLTWSQRFVGVLQIPLCQNFLSGQLYAVRRKELHQELQKKSIDSIPLGIVAEDTFLEKLVPAEKFTIIARKVYYEPPNLADYLKFLARMRWQEAQLAVMYGDLFNGGSLLSQSIFARAKGKIFNGNSITRLMLGIVTSGLRCGVKSLFGSRINQYYCAMGPVNKNGRNVLSEISRSNSAK